METIAAIFSAIAAFFGWKTKVSKTPIHEEIQEVRKERDEEIQYNADAVRYGVDPATGRVRYPSDK